VKRVVLPDDCVDVDGPIYCLWISRDPEDTHHRSVLGDFGSLTMNSTVIEEVDEEDEDDVGGEGEGGGVDLSLGKVLDSTPEYAQPIHYCK
jgi:hypothetical protein